MAVPGGKVKLGETLREAAEREILEETGIRIHAGKSVFTFEYIERDASEDIVFHYVIIDLEADYLGGDIHAADDALEARWLSSGQLKELNVNQTTRNLLKEIYNFG